MQAKKYMTEMINSNDSADGPPSQGAVLRLKCKQQPMKDHPLCSFQLICSTLMLASVVW